MTTLASSAAFADELAALFSKYNVVAEFHEFNHRVWFATDGGVGKAVTLEFDSTAEYLERATTLIRV